ncbi:addiction module protein [Thiomicrospira sp. ALE5]|uniref:addiction module protein n=1 Tax=Thiomicrospira sp. ALE5 TaxID=748650 RepID=UPI0008E8813B|nr:addiction module protein [Thiomicrospira sp. ALE5]SFR49174.1 Putative addiction module component [Thiomicrospira sp. ALE5]
MLVDTKKIDELPLSTKLELMEVVMSALIKNEAEFAVPAWHEDVLEARAQEVREPDAWKTFDQVRAALKND